VAVVFCGNDVICTIKPSLVAPVFFADSNH
jgi:hypothetical protein